MSLALDPEVLLGMLLCSDFHKICLQHVGEGIWSQGHCSGAGGRWSLVAGCAGLCEKHPPAETEELLRVVLSLQGNKKGPLGRWDFDTQEEYSEYMNNKEALPK